MRDALCAHQLLAGGEEHGLIDLRPAVVLRAGKLDIVSLEIDRHLDDVFDLINVLAMDHDVEHHRIFVLLHQPRHVVFVLESGGTA